jgi:large subunit ribosomal protein L13
MRYLSYKTKFANKETHKAEWFVVDVEGVTVGRACSKIASVLRGKHKATYTPHADAGDYVIVLNADKITFSGNKWEDKKYITYSGYPGGQKSEAAKDLMARAPEKVIERAVKGMLPKNRLGRKMYKKLFVYKGTEHPHSAQKAAVLNVQKQSK